MNPFSKSLLARGASLILPLAPLLAPNARAQDSNTPTPVLNSSLTVEENSATYTVRVAAPETSDVHVRLSGSTLHLDSGTTPNGTRHEQRLSLPQAQADAALGIKRDNAQLVITIPKGTPALTNANPSWPTQELFGGDLTSFDSLRDQVLSQADAMVRQINRNADPQGAGTKASDLLNALLSGMAPPSGSTSYPPTFEIEELADKYLLVANLPEEEAGNISVNVDNGRLVTITSKQQQKANTNGAASLHSGTTTQTLTLPGPANGSQLTMLHKNGRLEITIPKE
jgi:HSP20 family molecular chaperone IbpA